MEELFDEKTDLKNPKCVIRILSERATSEEVFLCHITLYNFIQFISFKNLIKNNLHLFNLKIIINYK